MNSGQRFWQWLMGESPRDARGRRVSVAFLGGYPAALWSRIHSLPPEVHRRVRARCTAHAGEFIGPTLIVSLVILLPLMFAGFALSSRMRGAGWSSYLSGAMLPIVVQIPAMITATWYVSRRSSALRIVALLDEDYCPQCRYHLRGTPLAEDGCTVCPECGAAWRILAPATPLDEQIRGLASAGDSPMEIARRVGCSITEIEQSLARTQSRSTQSEPSSSPASPTSK